MPAINYDEDTEFNAALRHHGIIPPKESSSSRSPSPPPAPTSPTLSDELDLDDLDINKDDALPRAVIEKFRQERIAAHRQAESNRRFGTIFPVSKKDWIREVNEASEEELEGEPEGMGVGVVCCLYKNSIPACKILLPILHDLARLYPSSKFVSIISDHCIENYPDKNCPTLIIYRKGKLMGQVVGLGAMGGENCKLVDVERMLFAFRGIDFHLKVGNEAKVGYSESKSSAAAPLSKFDGAASRVKSEQSSDENSSGEDEQTFVGGGKRSGIRRGTAAKKPSAGSDSDEFDL